MCLRERLCVCVWDCVCVCVCEWCNVCVCVPCVNVHLCVFALVLVTEEAEGYFIAPLGIFSQELEGWFSWGNLVTLDMLLLGLISPLTLLFFPMFWILHWIWGYCLFLLCLLCLLTYAFYHEHDDIFSHDHALDHDGTATLCILTAVKQCKHFCARAFLSKKHCNTTLVFTIDQKEPKILYPHICLTFLLFSCSYSEGCDLRVQIIALKLLTVSAVVKDADIC